MVILDLGNRLVEALNKFSMNKKVTKTAVDQCIKEISNALISADINIALVKKLRLALTEKLLKNSSKTLNMQKYAQGEIFRALVDLLSLDQEPFTPEKGKCSVVLMVGLQGAGKTTTASKLANYYKRQGFKTALVCADTFRAGAFAQLKQNASRCSIPFYGSNTNPDAAQVASEGVRAFRSDRYEIILVDTSGRHKDEAGLLKEMKDISKATNPDHSIFVIDGTAGQAAVDQAKFFKSTVDLGSAIITKMDGNSKGGGALSAVHTAGVPIAFLGKGEKMTDLERFSANNFVKRLLGMGDIEFLVSELEQQEEGKDLEKALGRMIKLKRITFKDLRRQIGFLQQMGSFSYLMEMIPGLSGLNNGSVSDALAESSIKKSLVVMDSLSEAEMNSDGAFIGEARKRKIAYGSGLGLAGVAALFNLIKPFKAMLKSGVLKKLAGAKGMPDANILKQLGGKMGFGAGQLESMMKQMNVGGLARAGGSRKVAGVSGKGKKKRG